MSLQEHSFREIELVQFIEWVESLGLDSFRMAVKVAEKLESRDFNGSVLDAFAKLKVKDKRLT